MRRTSMQLAAAVLASGLAVAACGSIKMGAAAITGQQRISSATLSDQVASLTTAYQADNRKGIKPQRAVTQMPQQVLTWLITFRIYDELAAQHGISVTPAAVQSQLNALAAQARQQKVSTATYVSAAGAVPPDLVPQIGRYFAILSAFQRRLDGGKPPTAPARQQALQNRISHAQCLAAKNLGITVNPQFGQFDYTTFSVVPAPSQLAASPSPSPSASASAKPRLTPPC
ncbi:MAG TPA: SurA N-terminal domain-containing protein [Streptosporangiaceae bacterium]|nr:SurA N-terminal domain-containing protein [Streptosporangiaceae bacterium]